ncbi:MAG TPA: hypothetical protein PLQ12_00880 [Candidatus Defluviicoccus seviourii]|nr:hypothetical protein [Candidatus Defluviicoccus seviourii]
MRIRQYCRRLGLPPRRAVIAGRKSRPSPVFAVKANEPAVLRVKARWQRARLVGGFRP